MNEEKCVCEYDRCGQERKTKESCEEENECRIKTVDVVDSYVIVEIVIRITSMVQSLPRSSAS
jgi:hypothetical protein